MHAPTLARHGARFVFPMLLIAGAQHTFAEPIFEVYGEDGAIDKSSSGFVSDSSNLEGSVTDPISGQVISSGAINAFAAAGPGVLRVDANSRIFNLNTASGGGTNDASANAAMTLDDVIVSGPAGMLTTAYKIHLSGTLEASNDSQATSGASAIVGVQLLGNGILLNDSSAIQNSGQPQIDVDLLENFTGNDDLTSDPFTVTANQAFTVIVRLGVSARSSQGAFETGSVSAAAHFTDTLTFATDGPVFDLPAGYTVNSISGNIVDNHFVTVPEPTMISLLMVLLAVSSRRAKAPN